jgi:hypothetical protein
MAENMIKFLRGNVANLPQTATSGALYFTKDEGIYLGMEDGSYHRYGDFITVADVDSLPASGAHETCMYYCASENILARYDSAKGWIQINKQPTAEEMKTLLGLGSLAYKSEVVEGDLNTELAAKINAASGAQHTHANKDVIDGITATNIADWNDAVAKEHEHANKAELDLIASGDKAKWDAVAADHLTSADKTALENSIKEAKKAGTDANTALETYKVSNDARVLAVEEDIAEITDTDNGILAQAKTYSDGKLDAAKTAISAEIDADVKVVADDLAGYKSSNDAALAGVKATADAAAVKTEVEAELAKKVEKVEGKDLIATSEIERLATLHNYDDTALAGRVSTAEGKITALESASATHATKDELNAVDAKFADYNTTVAQKAIDDAQDARIKAIEDDYVVAADIANFETKDNVKKVADDLAAYVEANDAAVADRYTKEEADGKFALIADAYDDTELVNRVKAIEDDYLVEADKTALQDQITANANAITLLTDGADPDKVDSVKDLIDYVDKHGTEVTGMKEDIAENAKAISDHEALAAETYETKDDASAKLTEAKEYADGLNTAMDTRVKALEDIDHDAYIAADTALKTELQAEIDADVKALADGAVATNAANIAANTEAIATKANAADVYAKTETYNKSEIDGLLTWGEF